jgi:hypothetical protein
MRKKYTFQKGRKKVEIVAVDADNWFFIVTSFRPGKAEKIGMIVVKDVQLWVDKYKREGFSMEEVDI